MPAPKKNQNAKKGGKGLQVNFYLGADEVTAISRILERKGMPVTEQTIRAFARKQSKNGILQAVRDELPAIII